MLLSGFEQRGYSEETAYANTINYEDIQASFNIGNTTTPTVEPSSTDVTEVLPVETYNTMDIDFESLIAKEKNKTLLDMHKYFSSIKPTMTNKYAGLFKGNNLILITAESFSPYFISPELTPTLYKMSTEGFVFKNFFNPVWGVRLPRECIDEL